MNCWFHAPRSHLGPLRNIEVYRHFFATMPELVYVAWPFGCRINLCSWPACRDPPTRTRPRRLLGTWGPQRNTRRMAAAAKPAECIRVSGAPGGSLTGSTQHEAWNDSCISQQGRVVRTCRHVRGQGEWRNTMQD